MMTLENRTLCHFVDEGDLIEIFIVIILVACQISGSINQSQDTSDGQLRSVAWLKTSSYFRYCFSQDLFKNFNLLFMWFLQFYYEHCVYPIKHSQFTAGYKIFSFAFFKITILMVVKCGQQICKLLPTNFYHRIYITPTYTHQLHKKWQSSKYFLKCLSITSHIRVEKVNLEISF